MGVASMLLLAGLGNPGPRYANNRHNIGFMAVDEVVRRHSFSSWRSRFQADCAEGTLAGEKVLRSEEHTSELQSLMRISYAVFCLKTKKHINKDSQIIHIQTLPPHC